MPRRPTIPLYDWRFALHLEGAKHVQQQAGMPAVGCDCEDCRWWRSICHDVLPETLRSQLPRLGINLEGPSDVHLFGREGDTGDFLIEYHTVGKVITSAVPEGQHVEIQREPVRVVMGVKRGAEMAFYQPDIPKVAWGEVLCIEVWVKGVERGQA